MRYYEIYIKTKVTGAGVFICSQERTGFMGVGGDTEHFSSLLHDLIFNEFIKKMKT